MHDALASAAQEHINRLLEAPQELAATSRQKLIDLRAMVAVALRFALAELLDDADPTVGNRFADFTTRREGFNHGVWGGRKPFDPLLMAGAARIAHRIVQCPDPESMVTSYLPANGPEKQTHDRSFIFDRTDWVRTSPRYTRIARRAVGSRTFEATKRALDAEA
ncbi:hypothetical protein [Streptomyces tauricus]